MRETPAHGLRALLAHPSVRADPFARLRVFDRLHDAMPHDAAIEQAWMQDMLIGNRVAPVWQAMADWPATSTLDLSRLLLAAQVAQALGRHDDARARYAAALQCCMKDENVDGVLVMLTPQAMTDPMGVAQAIISISDKLNRRVICCWMGEAQVAEARKLLEDSGIPAFRMPETAIELFHHISKYYRNQKLLL